MRKVIVRPRKTLTMKRSGLSPEELAIEKALGEGRVTFLPKSETRPYQDWAKAQTKDASIHLRINSQVLKGIKAIASASGMKYQTYLGEIINREAAKAMTAKPTSKRARA